MMFPLTTFLKMALCVSAVTAVALPQPQATPTPAPNANIPPSTTIDLTGQVGTDGSFTVKPAPNTQSDQGLQKRVAPIVAVAGIAAAKGAIILTKIAIEVGADTIKNLGEWNEAREAFTKKTTAEMWARNPDYSKFPAAICYNKAYSLQDPNGKDGLLSAKLSLGVLNTDYDCMYMTGNNKFFTKSDGGYANLAYTYNSKCTFDQKTGDLSCAA
ncbi:hypothetical protein N0V93_002577 [Gnomoniopsis smithogilvyi]|uniref:DUF7888 domain-containing protein n=1 Tax=Gnomoniopsis smithogilvyi TaxID=1191159 RepID=A0A9W8YWR6_9PEZI|nr:hypothetical protein N0V93_002577 [Gnomoniopsis smithogilvyi]